MQKLTLAVCLCGVSVMAAATLYAASYVESARLAASCSESYITKQRLQAEIWRLEIEFANLARPQRIAELAKRLGYVMTEGGNKWR